jgi:hypothetical protein
VESITPNTTAPIMILFNPDRTAMMVVMRMVMVMAMSRTVVLMAVEGVAAFCSCISDGYTYFGLSTAA